jgi:hypothetical protein
MQTIIKNRLKQPNLFLCRHPAHRRFSFVVSPYHIFEQKRCHKEGCVQFLWKCKIFGKDFDCPRGFKHVGRNCGACKHYYEEKVCRKPESLIGEQEMAAYFNQLDDYRYWLSTVIDKKVPFSGKISGVFPSLLKIVDYDKSEIRLNGFLLRFEKANIGYDLFDDRIYMQVGQTFLRRSQPAEGDSIDCEAILKTDRGRIVMINPTRIEFCESDNQPLIDYSRTLVGKSTGEIVKDNCGLCRGCPYGALMDIVVIRPQPNQYRRFYCLRGVEISKGCPIRLEEKIDAYENESAET